jgi:hypothetical protein
MSENVSQLFYWREGQKPSTNETTNISQGGPGAQYLSYDVFMGLSVLGGFFALDHLYLRSPLTFLAKLIINFLTFGAWWIYDATQAVFNRDVVKVFGLGVPGVGPKGIGAGVLVKDVPDKKHLAFFVYGLSLMLGGLFGLDSFVLGNNPQGIMRIVALISVIFAPVAIGYWIYNMYKFYFKTGDLIKDNWEYFGATESDESTKTIDEKVISSIPILGSIFGTSPFRTLINLFSDSPLKTSVNAAVATAQSGIDTVREGIELGKTTVDKGANIIGETIQTAKEVADSATKAIGILPQQAAQFTTGFTVDAARAAKERLEQAQNVALESAAVKGAISQAQNVVDKGQSAISQMQNVAKKAEQITQLGGANSSNTLTYALIGTFGAIIVSGLILTYRRVKQNGKPRKDDSPPQPGVLRKSNKKESP